MRHVRLGRTGLPVSRLCLGTMTFGLQCDEATSVKILDHALDSGITFLDTADAYPLGGGIETAGRTEEIVGRWLQGRRHDVILATKGFGATSARPWDRGSSRKHLLDAIDASLRRLRTDHVDLYQLHHPDADTPIDLAAAPGPVPPRRYLEARVVLQTSDPMVRPRFRDLTIVYRCEP